jgi:hypothetical protein
MLSRTVAIACRATVFDGGPHVAFPLNIQALHHEVELFMALA